ncbi:MAG: hypothetical protein AAFX87_05260 [Bacteroidota bacterium]
MILKIAPAGRPVDSQLFQNRSEKRRRCDPKWAASSIGTNKWFSDLEADRSRWDGLRVAKLSIPFGEYQGYDLFVLGRTYGAYRW